jgi:ribosome-binding factor A
MRIRPEKVANLMRREVADILQQKLRDPRISAMVSVTDVEVTQDLSFARVFVSIMGDPGEREATLHALVHAAGFVRRELSPRLGLREVPEVRFVHDESLQRGARVEELLKRIHEGKPPEDEEGAEEPE